MECFSNTRKNNKQSNYLYDFIKKKIDLSQFLETEIGCTLQWYEENISAGTVCPLPHHKDTKPSFRIKFMEQDSVWVFQCFGCGAKGTIIDFCIEYYGLNNAAEAIWFLCNKFGYKESAQLVADSLKDVKKKMNLSRRMECTHIVSSNQCRALLRKDYSKYGQWVTKAYHKMNKALDEEDIDAIEEVGFEASSKIREK